MMSIMQQHSYLEINKNMVKKISMPNLMSIEVGKTLKAYDLAKKSGLFVVPEVLEYNESLGIVVFERIHNIVPVFKVLKRCNNSYKLISRIAEALFYIHNELDLPSNLLNPLPEEIDTNSAKAFLHGDFNAANIFLKEDSDDIVILDWQMTSRHGGIATWGSRYFDVIWFVNYLLWMPSLGLLYRNDIPRLCVHFAREYMQLGEKSHENESIIEYSEQFFRYKLSSRAKNSVFRNYYYLPISYLLTQRFISLMKRD